MMRKRRSLPHQLSAVLDKRAPSDVQPPRCTRTLTPPPALASVHPTEKMAPQESPSLESVLPPPHQHRSGSPLPPQACSPPPHNNHATSAPPRTDDLPPSPPPSGGRDTPPLTQGSPHSPTVAATHRPTSYVEALTVRPFPRTGRPQPLPSATWLRPPTAAPALSPARCGAELQPPT